MQETVYSRDEVARHDGQSGRALWIILKNSVYDVTDYMDKHPGGRELLEEYAGQDATVDFNNFGHSSDAIKTLKSLKIGEIEAKTTNAEIKKMRKKVTAGNEGVKVRKRLFFPLFRSCAT